MLMLELGAMEENMLLKSSISSYGRGYFVDGWILWRKVKLTIFIKMVYAAVSLQ